MQLKQQLAALQKEHQHALAMHEGKEAELLALQAQVDLLKQHSCEAEGWLTGM